MNNGKIAAAFRLLAEAVDDAGERVERDGVEVAASPQRRDLHRDAPNCSGVYFVRYGERGEIKIGRTKNIRDRLRRLQTTSPIELVLLAYRPGSGHEEKHYHHCFAHARTYGEWFRPVPELLACIEELRRALPAVEPMPAEPAKPVRGNRKARRKVKTARPARTTSRAADGPPGPPFTSKINAATPSRRQGRS